jgi:N utilization substance protein B
VGVGAIQSGAGCAGLQVIKILGLFAQLTPLQGRIRLLRQPPNGVVFLFFGVCSRLSAKNCQNKPIRLNLKCKSSAFTPLDFVLPPMERLPNRRKIREKVAQAIFAWAMSGNTPDFVFEQMLRSDHKALFSAGEMEHREEAKLLHQLYYKAVLEYELVPELAETTLENWALERVAMMDRVLITLAVTEFKHLEEVPTRVTLNEYIEIAKRYSTEKSPAFINGVLDAVLVLLKERDQVKKVGKGLLEFEANETTQH